MKIYFPSSSSGSRSNCNVKVLYLPSTCGEEPPVDKFSGREIVYVPIHPNSGKVAWKNPVPPWLVEWVADAMAANKECKWSICGFSRGAAWAALLAAKFRFERVLLIAPYVWPCLSPEDRGQMRLELPKYGQTLAIVFGSLDYYQACDLFEAIRSVCVRIDFEGVDHEGSKKKALVYWQGLLPPSDSNGTC